MKTEKIIMFSFVHHFGKPYIYTNKRILVKNSLYCSIIDIYADKYDFQLPSLKKEDMWFCTLQLNKIILGVVNQGNPISTWHLIIEESSAIWIHKPMALQTTFHELPLLIILTVSTTDLNSYKYPVF